MRALVGAGALAGLLLAVLPATAAPLAPPSDTDVAARVEALLEQMTLERAMGYPEYLPMRHEP